MRWWITLSRVWNFTHVAPRTEGTSGQASLVVMLESIRDACVKSPESLSVLSALIFEALGPTMELRQRFAEMHENERKNLASVIARGIAEGSIDPHLEPDVEVPIDPRDAAWRRIRMAARSRELRPCFGWIMSS
jgi:hypothetical protein